LATVTPSAGDVVLVSGYNIMYPGLSEAVLSWVGQLNPAVLVAFDPANRIVDVPGEARIRMLQRANVLLMNATEGAELSGVQEVRGALVELARIVSHVVIRTGAEGCLVSSNGEVEHVPAYQAEVVDLNGAGDCHNGAFLAEWLATSDAFAAASFANAAAAMAIEAFGPASAPTREAIARRFGNFVQ
jgi:sugar/nucleoside kinase (ribokinase family)